METMKKMITAATISLCALGLASAWAANLSGAIFTTTADGTVVNENVHYQAKPDVYLDGGPGPHAPAGAAGLPAGDYYFQVTDPSGKDLLSSDHVSCRKVRVNGNGVFDLSYAGTNWVKSGSTWVPAACQHASGVDADHAALGATTVQLFPYDDTPNAGGVYKVWVTRVEDYTGDPNLSCSKGRCAVNGESYQPGNYHGFVPARSKTDNYKVKKNGKPFLSPEIAVRKFHDRNADGLQQPGEEDITGWQVGVGDPLGIWSLVYTPATVVAEPSGTWTFVEAQPVGTLQTASLRDGVQTIPVSATVDVAVSGSDGEKHTVVYGNVALGSITACKVYDRNANGADLGDAPLPGWRMQLTGTDARGQAVGPLVATTGADGCTTFSSLLPGTYTVTELFPGSGGWSTRALSTSADFTIESSLSGAGLSGTAASHTFANFCFGSADFGTKGFWHNVNGLTEMSDADIEHVNGLAPYAEASDYFAEGDEPFDGAFAGGAPVAAAQGPAGEAMAAAGTPRAEVSHFLVDSNAEGDPREQLAQQLLAFTFNTRHRLDDARAMVQLPDGSLIGGDALVELAVAAWVSGTPEDQRALQQVLDTLNNSDALPYVHFVACAPTYE
jgi:hypothetical protein